MYNDPLLQPATGATSTMPTIGHLIDGKLVGGGSRSQDVFNPATGRPEKRLLLADQATMELAIASAQAAYPAWRATPPLKRARVMGKLKQLLEENADRICALLTAEHGKVVGDAMASCSAASKTSSTPVMRPSCSRVNTARTSGRPSTRGASSSRWA